MQNLLVIEEGQGLTLGQFRQQTAGLPDTMPIAPRFFDPGSLSDDMPGVRIDGLAIDFDGEVPVLAIAVDLEYLNDSDPRDD